MRIVDVRTVLLTGPSTNDPYLGRTRRSAAFIEILTDTELTGLGETYAGYFEQSPPARTTIGVAALPGGAEVEMDAIIAL